MNASKGKESGRSRVAASALFLGKIPAMARKPRLYSYQRFSSPEQAKGDSLRRQTEAATRWAAENGMTLDTSLAFRDEGVSAFKGKNVQQGSALRAFLDAVETGRVPQGSALYVESLDRLSRQRPMAALMLLNSIVEAGVDVVADGRRYTPENLSGPELFGALAVMLRAHDESQTKSMRGKAAWAGARKKWGAGAIVPGGKCPWYLRVDPKTRQPSVDPKLGKLARQMALDYVRGTPLREIVRDVNSDGIPSPQGSAWSRVQLTRTLRSLASRDGPSPLDRSEKLRLRAALKRRRSEGRPRGDGGVSILRGLGRCGYCGNPLAFSRAGPYAYLRCTTNSEYPGRCDGPGHIRYEPIAGTVVTLALKVADNPPGLSRGLVAAQHRAAKEAARLFEKAQKTEAAFTAGPPSREGAKIVLDAYLAAREAHQKADEAWQAARPGFDTVDADAIRNAGSDEAMNKAIRGFLQHVDVRHEKDGRGDPGRGTVVFHFTGGGKMGLRYEAKRRPRVDRGRAKTGTFAPK